MKTRLLIILLLLAPAQSWAWMGVHVAGSGVPAAAVNECDGKLICQNFEGTGYDNSETWTESGSTIDEDYTTTALRGSQSLLLDNAASGSPVIVSAAHAGASTYWGFFRLRFPGNLPSANTLLFAMRGNTTGDPTTIVEFYYRTSFTGLRAADGSSAIDSSAISADTTYYVWIRYTAGTGADGVVTFYLDTDNTRPAAVGSITNSAKTASVTHVAFMIGSTQDVIIDQVLTDDAEITDVSS